MNIFAEELTPNRRFGEEIQPFEEDIGGVSIEVDPRGHASVSNPDEIDRFLIGV